MAAEEFHHEVRLDRILDELVDADQVRMAELHPELGLADEGPVLLAILGPRGQQLLQGEPALRPLLHHLHHDRGVAGMDRPDVAIAADSIVAGRIDVGGHGAPPIRAGTPVRVMPDRNNDSADRREAS